MQHEIRRARDRDIQLCTSRGLLVTKENICGGIVQAQNQWQAFKYDVQIYMLSTPENEELHRKRGVDAEVISPTYAVIIPVGDILQKLHCINGCLVLCTL